MRRLTALLTGLVLALAAPAQADPFDDLERCTTTTGEETLVDAALCLVWVHLPPDVQDELRPVVTDPAVGCVAGHVERCDEILCPHLAAQAPGHPPVLDIRPDGDVHVAGEWVWDCPPYAG